jgi:hypothetical protein
VLPKGSVAVTLALAFPMALEFLGVLGEEYSKAVKAAI